MRLRLLFGGIAALVIVALVAFFVLRRPATAPPPAVVSAPVPAAAPAPAKGQGIHFPEGAAQLALIRAESVRAGTLPLADLLPARLAYDDDVTARVFPAVAGRLVTLKADAGQHVRAGQVLALVDAPDRAAAEADLRKAVADEDRKRLAFERARALGPGEGIAEKDLEAARADLDVAQAETERARLRLRNLAPRPGASAPAEAASAGAAYALTAPIAGTVTERNASPALEVAPGGASPLFVISDLRRLWVLVDLPETLLSTVHEGGALQVEADAFPGETFQARVERIGRVLDPNSRRVTVRARLENPGERLLPEMFVRAALLQDGASGVRVPNTAIVTRGTRHFVFVETAPGRFERREVVLAVRGAETSWAREGLRDGERVVTTGALLLDAEIAAGAE